MAKNQPKKCHFKPLIILFLKNSSQSMFEAKEVKVHTFPHYLSLNNTKNYFPRTFLKAILSQAEEQQLLPSADEAADRRPQAVHVFCAPKDLEYVVRTEKFCSGEVADGICFAFRTTK